MDRYSGWLVVKLCWDKTSAELVVALREYFGVYGVPEQLTMDGAQVFVSSTTMGFLETWGLEDRVATAYIPHANLRAESGVKLVKRWLWPCWPTGTPQIGIQGSPQLKFCMLGS